MSTSQTAIASLPDVLRASGHFHTSASYLSGGVCGHLWMPCALAGKPFRKDLRSYGGFQQGEGESFRDVLLSILCHEGGDFQDARFTSDTVIRVERRTRDHAGIHHVHVREREISQLPDCADLVLADSFVGDFMGDCD